MKAYLTKRFRFEAAHRLPNHGGKCARPHGHSYVLEVTVFGDIKGGDGSPDEGMVMDFGEISKVVKELVVERFDHRDLNEVCDFVTTAENLAVYIMKVLVGAGLNVYRVRLKETESGWVDVYVSDLEEGL